MRSNSLSTSQHMTCCLSQVYGSITSRFEQWTGLGSSVSPLFPPPEILLHQQMASTSNSRSSSKRQQQQGEQVGEKPGPRTSADTFLPPSAWPSLQPSLSRRLHSAREAARGALGIKSSANARPDTKQQVPSTVLHASVAAGATPKNSGFTSGTSPSPRMFKTDARVLLWLTKEAALLLRLQPCSQGLSILSYIHIPVASL